MENGELIDYSFSTGNLMRIKRGKDEFLICPGDRLTMVPVVQPKRVTWLHRLWLKYAPEFWRRHKRHQSYQRFLAKQGLPHDPYFGTAEHIADEKIRVLALPKIEFNDFDPRRRTRKERGESLDAVLRQAIVEHRVKQQ